MEATPDNLEKKKEQAEESALAGSSEKEADQASTKGAKEAYGVKEDQKSAENGKSSSGFPTKKEDWHKVDDQTYKSKDGDTWRVVDEPTDDSMLYSNKEWEELFSWSSADKNGQSKAFDDDDWWYDFGLENPFKSGTSKEKDSTSDKNSTSDKDSGLLASLASSAWNELALFFNDVYSDLTGKDAEVTDATKTSAQPYVLSDGSKLAADGSWVELAAETQKLIQAGTDQPIVRKYVDKDGKEASIEIANGKVVHVGSDGTRAEITDKRITVAGTDSTVTSKNKETGEITSANAKRGVSFEQGPDGQPRKFTKGDVTIEQQGDQWVISDGQGRKQTLSKDQIQTLIGLRRITQGTDADPSKEEAPPREPIDVEVNRWGKAIRDKDGTIIAFHLKKHQVSIRIKDGPEILIDRDGNARMRIADGQIAALDKNHLPPGATIDEQGNIHLKNGLVIGSDGRVRTKRGDVMDSKTGDLTVRDEDTGETVELTNRSDGSHCLKDRKGRPVSDVNPQTGEIKVTTLTGETITFDYRKLVLRTADIVMAPRESRLWDGTRVFEDGRVEFPDGTVIEEDNDTLFPDGTEVEEDGDVNTPDGQSFSSQPHREEAVRKTPEGIASYANALSSSIAGKANVAPGDIAALQGALGVISALLPRLTELGLTDLYAKLKDSQGNILSALAHAQGKANPGAGSANQRQTPAGPGSDRPTKGSA